MNIYPSYTYLIGWTQHDIWYYGVRYANKCEPIDDLWKKYFTSSKLVKKYRKTHGEPDIITVDKMFNDPKDAIDYEIYKLKQFDVLNESKWLNQAIGRALGPDSPRGINIGKDNGFYGKTHSEETKAHLSKIRKGKRCGNENPFYGKKHSNETKERIRNKKINVPNYKLSKPVNVRGVLYPSRKSAADAHGVSTATINYWISKGDAYYI